MSTTYDEFEKLSQLGNLRPRFSTYQWVALTKLTNGQKLSFAEIKTLIKCDVLSKNQELTLLGRMCLSKLSVKKKKKKKIKLAAFNWETE